MDKQLDQVPLRQGPIQKPTINSVIARYDRSQHAAMIAAGIDPDEKQEDSYTETELKLMAEAKAMTLQEHLTELRRRIIICIVTVLIFMSISYYYSEELLHFITAPAGKLYYMRPTEAFFTYMRVAFYAGLIISYPVIIYQIWAFVIPALTRGERKLSNVMVPIAVLLFWLGMAFAYFFALPAAIKFFIGFETADLMPLFSVGRYLDFVTAFVFPFGIVFELPLIVTVLASVGIISSEFLKEKRKYFLLIAFIIGAAISPTPDVISQSMIALPMVVLYELSYYLVRYILRK